MDQDLEKALNVVDAQYPDEITREGAILTGFSRGGWAVPAIAAMHKGRWPYLIINEADVTLSRASLEAAGVKAAVLMAGEWGSQLPGERQTVARLRKEGFRAELIVMPKAGHYYSANISELMRQAIAFLLETPEG
jgi:alpha/beta superfamily hydrolase